MRNLLPLLGFVLLSCGQMQPGDEPAAELREQSGTRLKREAYVAADGSVVPLLTLLDTKLGQRCLFQAGPDRRYYCLPVGGTMPSDLSPFVAAELMREP